MKLDVGTEILQIVCGANVETAQYVAVSLEPALPNGLEIKPTKLRELEQW